MMLIIEMFMFGYQMSVIKMLKIRTCHPVQIASVTNMLEPMHLGTIILRGL